ncbi:hypothetical protein AXF42_Ash021095 [Apostasia shenzhenica]|uniref:Uncharacterized protein n=1 Tax=Apostasia shenzhenica TaxID=1088818 RepID=A0A2I0A3D7_9ASPA|nr:hypothetical protein AXF42_Ash021095 [Apostasia shenzhenica]
MEEGSANVAAVLPYFPILFASFMLSQASLRNSVMKSVYLQTQQLLKPTVKHLLLHKMEEELSGSKWEISSITSIILLTITIMLINISFYIAICFVPDFQVQKYNGNMNPFPE